MTAPFVSVVIVNYNGRRFLDDCLGSLRSQNYPRHRYEAVLVDNASADGSVDLVRERFPEVRVVALRRNCGFAEGNNVGFRHARGEWFALLNNDAAAEPGWLSASVAAGQGATDVGGVASHVVFRDEPRVINSIGLDLYRDGRGGDRGFRQPDLGRQPVGEVFGGCGAGLLLRRRMIAEVGGFDPALFMYYEDLELAWRCRRAGWRFVYAPSARVRHVFGASAGVASPLQVRCVERNRGVVNVRHAPVWLAVGTVVGSLARCGRAAFRCSRGVIAARPLTHARAFTELMTRAPFAIARRFSAWTAGRVNGDSVYRRWARPGPG
jgi:GT2 family glycosyltransferase